MKKHSRAYRDLQASLRYWQMQVRLEMRWLMKSKAKCREIAKKMRQETVAHKPNNP